MQMGFVLFLRMS